MMDDPAVQGVEQTRKALLVTRLIHVALLLGTMIFGGVVAILTSGTMEGVTRSPIILVAAGVSLSSIVISLLLGRVVGRSVSSAQGVGRALAAYQTACLVRWAPLEGGCLFSAVSVLVSRTALSWVFYALCLAVLVYLRPSQEEFSELERHDGVRSF